MTKPRSVIGVWGSKKPMREASDVLDDANKCYSKLKKVALPPFLGVHGVRDFFLEPSRHYYSLAAMSRRRVVDASIRDTSIDRLFSMRTILETRIDESLRLIPDQEALLKQVTKSSFFGKSIKQGVSIRYPLSTCVPTKSCGGRCYAHDGRDRDYQRLFRGVLNGFIGSSYEDKPYLRGLIMKSLSREIDQAIRAAREDALLAKRTGFNRMPRIRFSHVGEMTKTPTFANDLAKTIKSRDSEISCVIYTRHPDANKIDSSVFVVNFTVEGSSDKRIEFMPRGSRLVCSSWDGEIFDRAEVNFLEHHVDKFSTPTGYGGICPVTVDHKATPTCDSARCYKCFVPTVSVCTK
jgi:hypothetical protein